MKTSRRNFFGFLFALPLALKAKWFPPIDHEVIATAKTATEIILREENYRHNLESCVKRFIDPSRVDTLDLSKWGAILRQNGTVKVSSRAMRIPLKFHTPDKWFTGPAPDAPSAVSAFPETGS